MHFPSTQSKLYAVWHSIVIVHTELAVDWFIHLLIPES